MTTNSITPKDFAIIATINMEEQRNQRNVLIKSYTPLGCAKTVISTATIVRKGKQKILV